MSSVDDRIRQAIGALAAELPVEQRTADVSDLPLPKRPTGRRPLGPALLAAAIVVVVLLVVSLTERGESVRTVDRTGGSCPAEAEGRIFLLSSRPGGGGGTLYSGSLCPFRFRADAAGPADPVALDGSDDQRVVVDRSGGMLTSSGAGPLGAPGLRDRVTVKDAAVSPDGVLAYIDSTTLRGDELVPQLYLYDPRTGDQRMLLADNRFLSRPSWSPDGRLVVLRNARDGEGPELTIVEPNAAVRHLPIEPAPLSGLVLNVDWGPANRIAVAYVALDAAGKPVLTTLLVEPDSGGTRVLRGWQALAWSPDGTALLVRNEDELARASADFEEFQRLGKVPANVVDGIWLPCGPPACEPSTASGNGERPPADGDLAYDEFQRLVQDGRVLEVEVREANSRITVQYAAADGTKVEDVLMLAPGMTIERFVQEALDSNLPVTIKVR